MAELPFGTIKGGDEPFGAGEGFWERGRATWRIVSKIYEYYMREIVFRVGWRDGFMKTPRIFSITEYMEKSFQFHSIKGGISVQVLSGKLESRGMNG